LLDKLPNELIEFGYGQGSASTQHFFAPNKRSQGRYRTNTVLLSNLMMRFGIELGKQHGPILPSGSRCESGRELQTRPTPRSPKVDQDWDSTVGDELGKHLGSGIDWPAQ
jgi:hypothetical protein